MKITTLFGREKVISYFSSGYFVANARRAGAVRSTAVHGVLLGILTSLLLSCNALLEDHQLPSDNDTQVQIQQLSDSFYQQFKTEWGIDKGGILIRTSNPAGTHFVSSNIEGNALENAHFRIASITKTFTAASIMRLYQEGLISLDVPITTYLPDVPDYDVPYKSQITIRQLLQHRGGVFDVTNQEIPETVNQPYAGMRYHGYVMEDLNQPTHTFTLDEMIGVAARNKLSNSAPDVEFHYSNTGYHLLAKIVKLTKKMSYTEYITKTFIQPLGLTNTYSQCAQVAEGNGSPASLNAFVGSLMKGKNVLTESTVKLMQTDIGDPTSPSYRLGCIQLHNLGYGHNGERTGYLSLMAYDPLTDVSVVAYISLVDKTQGVDPKTNKVDGHESFLKCFQSIYNAA